MMKQQSYSNKFQNKDSDFLRLFLAIFPPVEYINYFKKVIQIFDKEKRNLKYIPLDQLHITLKFIGNNVSSSTKDIIVENLNRLKGRLERPEIKMNSITFGFQHQTYPDILVANIVSTKTLLNLSNQLHNLVKFLGLEDTVRWKNKHYNHFHITLARLKNNVSYTVAKRIKSLSTQIGNDDLPDTFFPSSYSLISSRIKNSTITYKILETFDF